MPDSFQPDSFTPDVQDSFVPDNFTPDVPVNTADEFETVEVSPGQWMSRKRGETTEQALSRVGHRPDELMVGGVPELFEGMRYGLVNKIAMSNMLPESVKPWATTIADLPLEALRAGAEMFSQPEGLLLPSGLRRLFGEVGTKAAIIPDEVLPPEAPIIRGALPAHENPFIAGARGQVQRKDILIPQEEARLAGYPDDLTAPIASEPGRNAAVDLGELREVERLKRLSYGQFEHEGGTPLILPDRPPIETPPVAGDTGLGFNRASTGDLPYPLNVVPEAVRPRSTQEVTRAIVGDDFARQVLPDEPVTFESGKPIIEKPPKPVEDLKGGTAAIRYTPEGKPAEPILPSAPPRPSIARGLPPKVVSEANANTGLKIENATIPPNIPKPIAEAVSSGVKKLAEESQQPSWMLKGVYTQLKELGSTGRELVHRFQRAAQNRAEYDAVWTEPLFKVGGHLSASEKANFGAYVEQRIPVPNQRVQAAVDSWNKLQNMMGDTAVAEKLHGEGDRLFQKIENNYWPHIPVERLTKKSIIDRLVEGGMTRYDAIRVAKTWGETGEIKIGPQHTRLNKIFEYKDDFNAAIQHGRSMARRIANHKNLGAKDIAGKDDQGVANLIEDTNDPNLAMKLAKRLAGRDEKPSEKLMKGLNQSRMAASLSSLPNFSIKNVILGQATNAQMALLSRHPIAAVKEISQLFKSAYRDEIRSSGVYNTFNRTLMEELHGVDPFQIGAGEKINRSVAAAIGRSTVRAAFEDYKAGVNTRSSGYFLETLLARNPDEITAITPELERFAAGRMAEITQGLNNPGNLPYHWSDPVNTYGALAGQLALIFKKVGFQVTKTVKDSIMVDPIVAIPSWLAITQVAGEMANWVGSALTGKERPEDLVERIAQNWGAAYLLGLPWESATSAQYGPTAAISTAAGPIFGKASELGYDIWQTGANLMNEDNEDPFRQMRRFGLRNLPIPGRERVLKSVEEED